MYWFTTLVLKSIWNFHWSKSVLVLPCFHSKLYEFFSNLRRKNFASFFILHLSGVCKMRKTMTSALKGQNGQQWPFLDKIFSVMLVKLNDDDRIASWKSFKMDESKKILCLLRWQSDKRPLTLFHFQRTWGLFKTARERQNGQNYLSFGSL